MADDDTLSQLLRVPSRFENLRDAGSGALRSIVVPVEESLSAVDARFADLSGAGGGGLMILRGDSGSGKSTFLDTIGLFRSGVITERITAEENLRDAVQGLEPSTDPRIVVLEGREALGESQQRRSRRECTRSMPSCGRPLGKTLSSSGPRTQTT